MATIGAWVRYRLYENEPRLRIGCTSSQPQEPGGTAGGQGGEQARDGRTQREVDPEQVVKRPHRALPPDRREHRRRGGEREARPGPGPASRAPADDARGEDADREQRGEIGRGLDHERVHTGMCGPKMPTAATTSVAAASMTTAPQRRTISSSSGKAT